MDERPVQFETLTLLCLKDITLQPIWGQCWSHPSDPPNMGLSTGYEESFLNLGTAGLLLGAKCKNGEYLLQLLNG